MECVRGSTALKVPCANSTSLSSHCQYCGARSNVPALAHRHSRGRPPFARRLCAPPPPLLLATWTTRRPTPGHSPAGAADKLRLPTAAAATAAACAHSRRLWAGPHDGLAHGADAHIPGRVWLRLPGRRLLAQPQAQQRPQRAARAAAAAPAATGGEHEVGGLGGLTWELLLQNVAVRTSLTGDDPHRTCIHTGATTC